MPIVASQHEWKDKDHVLLEGWPEDCTVQWGGGGVVLSSKPGGNYRTAFFEAFPKDGGFIRGEGETIGDAEKSALEQYRASAACDHLWGRQGYTNGGAICRRCKAFKSVFKPIVTLGSFREPLGAMALDMVSLGSIRPHPGDARSHRHSRRTWLKARQMGIDLPDFHTDLPDPGLFRDDDHSHACRTAVVAWLKDHLDTLEGSGASGLSGLFESLNLRSLRRLVEDHALKD